MEKLIKSKMDTFLKHDIAEAFNGRLYAYTPVLENGLIKLGIAEANIAGYTPVPMYFKTWDEAETEADSLNKELNLDADTVIEIIASSMAVGPVKTSM